ncbi:hypothetical protein CROQUDRAFT_97315 [Cronartium quercuum f. sp. fusiforme G11]|uniref:Uncharacterized protein n=1 Tax=Cronartium quercuum f. sp. fusiforme G11 TaxID=708437 RepID=A0A9P6T9K0_9BASI|nr:hypothetical protein CROQUDRAFT_97315 [Cronartium quercuum f. sp. fusiforme G11]
MTDQDSFVVSLAPWEIKGTLQGSSKKVLQGFEFEPRLELKLTEWKEGRHWNIDINKRPKLSPSAPLSLAKIVLLFSGFNIVLPWSPLVDYGEMMSLTSRSVECPLSLIAFRSFRAGFGSNGRPLKLCGFLDAPRSRFHKLNHSGTFIAHQVESRTLTLNTAIVVLFFHHLLVSSSFQTNSTKSADHSINKHFSRFPIPQKAFHSKRVMAIKRSTSIDHRSPASIHFFVL